MGDDCVQADDRGSSYTAGRLSGAAEASSCPTGQGSGPSVSQWQHTKQDVEVPLIFREKYLLTGYRVPWKSWTYYLLSFFHLHNESGNVWSHFIAIFIYLYKVHELCELFDVRDEPLTWPILGFLLCIFIYAVLSTFAHLFHSKSPLIHYTCYQIDYIGIGLNGFATGVLFYYFTGTESYYAVMPPALFMWLNALIAVAVCVIFSTAKLWYSRPYPPQRKICQIASVGGHVVFGTMPLLCATKHCLFDDPHCSLSRVLPHYYGFIWFFTCAYFFASATPERLAPGRFDIFGHGHQIFHVFAVCTSLQQFKVATQELPHRSRVLAAMSVPDLTDIFGSILAVIVLGAIFIYFTHQHRLDKVAKDEALEKKHTNGLVEPFHKLE